MTTAIFPPERSVDYTVLGLVSEIAELVEVQHDKTVTSWQVRLANYKKEAGDGFWYAAAVADALETSLEDITFTVEPMDHWIDLPEIIAGLVKDAGFMAGLVKKSIRDDDSFITQDRKNALLARLAFIMVGLQRLTYAVSSSPAAVTADNLNKLADRKARGVLQGAGDNR